MNIYIRSHIKNISVLIILVSIGIGPLLFIISNQSNTSNKFGYNFSENIAFQKVPNVMDKYFSFSKFDEMTQYNYIGAVEGAEQSFITTIIKYFSQKKNKEAISSVNKAYPKDWNIIQKCSLDIERLKGTISFKVIVSTDGRGRVLSNTLLYDINGKLYSKTSSAKLTSIVNAFSGDSEIAVIVITMAGNSCKEKGILPQKAINEMLNIIEVNRINYL